MLTDSGLMLEIRGFAPSVNQILNMRSD
jgi:hypothetical protein